VNAVLVLLVVLGSVSYPVVQQTCPVCVSSHDGVFTEFRMARDNGTVGLLAHDYLAGDSLFDLAIGDVIEVVFTDHSETFRLASVWRARALSSTKFQIGDEILKVDVVFIRAYGGPRHLTLQTCDGDDRVFFMAYPIKVREHRNSASPRLW
jgi:hypothetical protein